jgi:hypothetical protein
MQIFRIMAQLFLAHAVSLTLSTQDSVMIRMPLATASLLAIAISLAGCGEGKDKPAAAAPTPAPAAATTAPAAAAPAQTNDAATKAVVANYANMVFAVFSDAESTRTIKRSKRRVTLGLRRACRTCRAKSSASATPSSTTGKDRLMPGPWTKA